MLSTPFLPFRSVLSMSKEHGLELASASTTRGRIYTMIFDLRGWVIIGYG